jgi:hypothetical protein
MKKILLVIIIGFVLFSACSDDCDKENPTVLLVNDGSVKADIQIKTSGGNTENINNIQPGTSSEKRSFAPGEIEFTVTIQGVQDPVEYVLATSYCTEYTVTINEDNTVSSSGKKLEKLTVL